MTEPVILAPDDAVFIADVLHLTGRLLRGGHGSELGRQAASLTAAAARRLPPGSPWTQADHEYETSPLI